MDQLEIIDPSMSPVKTIEKPKEKRFFQIKDLKYSLPLTSDQLFKMLKNDNCDLLQSLPEVKIERDVKCISRGMRTKKLIYNKRCKGCQILYRLTTKTILEDNIIPIHCGRMKGSSLNIYDLNHFSQNYQKIKKYDDLENYVTNIFFSLTSKKIVKYTKYGIFNKNINLVVVSNILNRIMEEEKFKINNNYVWSFVCGGRLHTMTRDPSLLTLEELCKDSFYAPGGKLVNRISKDIIFQLVQYFLIFQKHSVSLAGEPKDVIRFQIDNLEYKNKIFPVKLVVKPGSLTTAQYEGHKYFTQDRFVKNLGLPYESISVFLNGTDSYLNSGESEYHRKRILAYRIGNKYSYFNNLTYHTGIGSFSTSYDFVCHLTFLIRSQKLTLPDNYHLMWNGLWMPRELRRASGIKFDSVLRDQIKNFYIRFDSLDYWSKDPSD